MLRIQYVWSSPISEEAHFSLPPLTCELPPRRGLRHYLVGSLEETQMAVDRLHLLHYAERFEWTRPLQLSENGIVINASPSDVLRYLHRASRLDVRNE